MLDELRKFFKNTTPEANIRTREDHSFKLHKRLYEGMNAKGDAGKSYNEKVIEYLVNSKIMESDAATRKMEIFLLQLFGVTTKSGGMKSLTEAGELLLSKVDEQLSTADKADLVKAFQQNSAEYFKIIKETVDESEREKRQHPDDSLHFSDAAALLYSESLSQNMLDEQTRQKISFEQLRHILDGREAIRQGGTEDNKALKELLKHHEEKCHDALRKVKASDKAIYEELGELALVLKKGMGEQSENLEKLSDLLSIQQDTLKNLKQVQVFLTQQEETQNKIKKLSLHKDYAEALQKGFQFITVFGSVTKSPGLIKLDIPRPRYETAGLTKWRKLRFPPLETPGLAHAASHAVNF